MERLLILGANGFLGARAAKALACGYCVTALGRNEVDIMNDAEVFDALQRVSPRFVLLTAALSDTAACAREPARSRQINVLGAETVARACEAIGARLVFCSSDQVYADSSIAGPHSEDEPLCPRAVYGAQKLEAETRVLAANPDAVCLRLSWLYDRKRLSPREHGSLLLSMLDSVARSEVLTLPTHDLRSLTNVWDVIANLPSTFTFPAGVYNFGSANDESTYALAARLYRLIGAADLLIPNEEAFLPNGRDIRMCCAKASMLGARFPSAQDALEKAFLTALQ